MKIKDPIILVDADVVIHFLKASKAVDMHRILGGNLYVLDIVLEELLRWKSFRVPVNNLLVFKVLKEMPFPEDNKAIRDEFDYLTEDLEKGDGESACMAVAKHLKYEIASSNTTDIKQYCLMHNIKYYTTLDMLFIAMQKEIYTLAECNQFIYTVISNDSVLPFHSMEAFLKSRNLKIMPDKTIVSI